MILRNKTTGRIIYKDLKIAKSFIDRMFGLLLPSNPRCLLFKTRFGIHTFFLKESIDVLILDTQMKVVKIKQALKPNWLFFWNPKYKIVIELPSKTVFEKRLKIGDSLKLTT